MKTVIGRWISTVQQLRTPTVFADFEDLKWPETYEQEWFFNSERMAASTPNARDEFINRECASNSTKKGEKTDVENTQRFASK